MLFGGVLDVLEEQSVMGLLAFFDLGERHSLTRIALDDQQCVDGQVLIPGHSVLGLEDVGDRDPPEVDHLPPLLLQFYFQFELPIHRVQFLLVLGYVVPQEGELIFLN